MTTTQLNAIKRGAFALGFKGAPGGWIYNRRSKPVAQGWLMFASDVAPRLAANCVERFARKVASP